MKKLLLLMMALATPVIAATTEQSARADRLNHEIRCVACQGQSIADSDADIAKDMRREILAQVEAGQTDEAIRQGLLDRYGDYVLFRPRFSLANLLLWLLPPMLAVLGAGIWVFHTKKSEKPTAQALSEEEKAALAKILENDSK